MAAIPLSNSTECNLNSRNKDKSKTELQELNSRNKDMIVKCRRVRRERHDCRMQKCASH